ncbi:uncharacterized protein TNCV_989011 [Trichonephila clavipes]|nr:uncharacterized protein TNCV_989011 [Trichonephila clavipes]
MSSSPVPLKTHRVGERYALNLPRAQTSSRCRGGVVRRGGASLGVVLVTYPWLKMTRSVAKSPRVAEQCEGHLKSLVHETLVEDLTARIVVASADIASTPDFFEHVRQSFASSVGCVDLRYHSLEQ